MGSFEFNQNALIPLPVSFINNQTQKLSEKNLTEKVAMIISMTVLKIPKLKSLFDHFSCLIMVPNSITKKQMKKRQISFTLLNLPGNFSL